MQRFFGLVLIGVGGFFVYEGVLESDSFVGLLTRFFSGTGSNTTFYKEVGGGAMLLVGLFLLMFPGEK